MQWFNKERERTILTFPVESFALIYKDGECVLRHMNGYSDLENKIPMQGNERYNIYSCSKPITCVAAMQLWEKGLFSLDADKEKYKNLLRPIDFRLVNNVPSPFVDVCFQSESEKNVIRQIIIGPKNSSTRVDLKLFLTTNGIYDVDVSKSASTYR